MAIHRTQLFSTLLISCHLGHLSLRSANHAVGQVGDEVSSADIQQLEIEVADALEEPLALAQHDGRDVQAEFVDGADREVLVHCRGAARDRNVGVASLPRAPGRAPSRTRR
jgi:hypothetical protein